MPHDPPSISAPQLAVLLRELAPRLDSLFANSSSAAWNLTKAQFFTAVECSVVKRFPQVPLDRQRVEEYLETLHVDDLVLASACMHGSEAAWEHFVKTYRGYLRATAGIITKSSRSGTDAQELADSLFAELFGLVDGKRGEASLFRYFHGRSSLKTWLRTVLAQRHIDRIRQSRRWESLDRQDGEPEKLLPTQIVPTPSLDPHRSEYLSRFLAALNEALSSLDPQDRQRLELYYARQKTLAEIGRSFGEHESSASRNLERIRRDLRAKVEEFLRTGGQSGGAPLSDAEILLCFQYAAEEVPIDFRQLFPEKSSSKPDVTRKESS